MLFVCVCVCMCDLQPTMLSTHENLWTLTDKSPSMRRKWCWAVLVSISPYDINYARFLWLWKAEICNIVDYVNVLTYGSNFNTAVSHIQVKL